MRLLLPVAALAVFAAAGTVLLAPTPAAHATSRRLSASVYACPPDGFRIDPSLDSAPANFPGLAIFDGRVVAQRDRPAEERSTGVPSWPTPVVWTFAVDRVLIGTVGGPGPVEVDGPRTTALPPGASVRVFAFRLPPAGGTTPEPGARLIALCGGRVDGGATSSPYRSVPPATTFSPARFAASVVQSFLAVTGVLGIVLVAAGTYLRAKALDLEATQSAAREAPHRPPQCP